MVSSPSRTMSGGVAMSDPSYSVHVDGDVQPSGDVVCPADIDGRPELRDDDRLDARVSLQRLLDLVHAPVELIDLAGVRRADQEQRDLEIDQLRLIRQTLAVWRPRSDHGSWSCDLLDRMLIYRPAPRQRALAEQRSDQLPRQDAWRA